MQPPFKKRLVKKYTGNVNYGGLRTNGTLACLIQQLHCLRPQDVTASVLGAVGVVIKSILDKIEKLLPGCSQPRR